MTKCVNCNNRSVGEPNEDGFAKCRECGCTNIIPRREDYSAARKVQANMGSLRQASKDRVNGR